MDSRMRANNYVDGNTARKMNTVPERIRREKRKQVVRRRQAERNVQRAMAFDLQYTVFLAVAMLITLVVCYIMLTLQAKITEQNSHIATLEQTLVVLNSENDAFNVRLNGSVDLTEIYKIATKELGMVYPENGQILQYDAANPDYVKQYKDVPVLDN